MVKEEMGSKFFSVKDVEKSYGEGNAKVKVLNGITTGLEKGKICVILGPSGSGKSTLLNVIAGLEQVDSGTICVDGEEISALNTKYLGLYRRNKLGFVFQFYNLIPNLTVKENIEVCEYLSNNPLPIDDLLHTLGLWEHKDKFPNQLSGGQQQRCAIGRALVKNPTLLLCDEPTGALDYNTSRKLLELIESINNKYKNTIIIVTHNEAIKNMAHKIIKLHDGKILTDYMNESVIPAKEIEW
ncbi:MAG: ABC transporter ATP-binding protein [Herbinix sp.]|nr:ABC transporter ATP-binding protein [Herbinix sp.]